MADLAITGLVFPLPDLQIAVAPSGRDGRRAGARRIRPGISGLAPRPRRQAACIVAKTSSGTFKHAVGIVKTTYLSEREA